MELGIVGLPNVGKSTLFNALTNAGAQSANYPFCTIEPNVGIVSVPDKRLDVLAEMYHPEKYTPAFIKFVDIAGLVRGASKGEGLGNKFLAHIREVDAIVHVVRCFEDGDIIHVDGSVDPVRDVETINLELILSDLEIVERRLEKVKKYSKNDHSLLPEQELLTRLYDALSNGQCARTVEMTEEEQALIADARLLTLKPIIYVANVAEEEVAGGYRDNLGYQKLEKLVSEERASLIAICAGVEAELSDMAPEEKKMFLDDLGIAESGLDQLIHASYDLLGLISFLTAGPQEVRAWTIRRGTKAPQAAGKIHTDFERGFIRAEVVSFEDLVREGGIAQAKEKGLYRSEGKDYVMQDGDVVLFRFNV